MAILKWSGIGITAGRGKIGGTVLSYNRGGYYMKNKVTPLNPSTISQGSARSRLGSLSQQWRGLTQAQMDAWNQAASATANQFPYVNANGDAYFLSGQALFIALNDTLVLTGTAVITAPPLSQAIVSPLTVALTMAAGAATASIAFTASPIPANTEYLIFMTMGFSPGISNFKNKLRFISSQNAAVASPINIAAAYIAKFGSIPVAGQKVGLHVVAVSTISGQQATFVPAVAIVGA